MKDNVLLEATKNGNLTQLQQWIGEGADINTSNIFNENLIYIAAQYGHTPIVKYLLDKKANPNQINNAKMNALHVSTMHGHLEIVKTLCEAGLDPHQSFGKTIRLSIENNMTRNAITLAVKYNHLDILNYFISHQLFNENDRLPTCHMINNKNDIQISQWLKLILPSPAEISESMLTVLFKRMIQHSMLNGLNQMLNTFPYIKNNLHLFFTDLLSSFYNDEDSYTYQFDQNHPRYSILPEKYAYLDIFNNPSLNFLLSHGLSPQTIDTHGQTLLHIAAQTLLDEYEEVYHIRFLLDHGFSIDATDHQGKTALHLAIENNLYYHAIFLIFWGANPKIKDIYGLNAKDKVPFFCEENTDDADNEQYRASLLKMIQNILD